MINPAQKLETGLFSASLKQAATRDGYGQALLKLGAKNPLVVALTADLMESTRTETFAKKYPDRFYDLGVQEQNLMGVAAGMALEGLIPFVNSYAVFSPGRNWEQLRVSVAYTNANVKIAGHHAGLLTGPDGVTHQATEDLALTRVLPNLTVITPADSLEAEKATMAAAGHEGPVYLRLFRAATPIFTTQKTPFTLGKAQVLRFGRSLTLISQGPLLYEALRAAEELDAEVLNLHTLKPLDLKTLIDSLKKTGRCLTIEDHQIIGGLGGAVAETIAENYPVPLKRLGLKGLFGQSGDPEALYRQHGLTWEAILKTAAAFIKTTHTP